MVLNLGAFFAVFATSLEFTQNDVDTVTTYLLPYQETPYVKPARIELVFKCGDEWLSTRSCAKLLT